MALQLAQSHYRTGEPHFLNKKLFFDLICGDFVALDETFESENRFIPRRFIEGYMPEIASDLCNGFLRLPAIRKREAFAYLHEREAQTIRNLKLEKYWQPSPFPAEEQGLI